jgi:MOSC domain-containing protein
MGVLHADGAAADPFGDALIGSHLVGPSGLKLTVGLRTPRCVVPTRAQDKLPAEPAILRTIVEAHRGDARPRAAIDRAMARLRDHA